MNPAAHVSHLSGPKPKPEPESWTLRETARAGGWTNERWAPGGFTLLLCIDMNNISLKKFTLLFWIFFYDFLRILYFFSSSDHFQKKKN